MQDQLKADLSWIIFIVIFFSFYDSVRQIVFAEHDKFAQHIACYSFWSFKFEHKSNLSIFSPNQNY